MEPNLGKLKTNKDLAFAYVRLSESMKLCVTAVNVLNRCISDFNQNLSKDITKLQ